MTDLNRKLFWLTALRLLIVFSITGLYGLYRLGLSETLREGAAVAEDPLLDWRSGALWSIFALVCVQTLVYIALLRFLRHRPTIHAYIQFGGDLLVITFLMYRLGTAGQSFSILYFVVISVASSLLRRSAGVVVATLAALLFTVMMWAPSWGLLNFLEQRLSLPESPLSHMPLATRIYSLSVHLAGFYVVAFLTSFLARDVTRAEERLRAKHLDLAYLEVVHRDVVQSISSGLVTTDLSGVITSVNRAGETILERGAEELLGVHVSRSGLIAPERWQELTECSSDGITRTEIERRRGGETAYLGLTLSHLRDAESQRRGYILGIEDLTQERRLQEQLRVKDRMAAIGEMAAGLAHEVGNPLAAISGSVQVLASSLDGDEAQRKLLEITLKESQRLDRTVKSFLQLASSRQRRLVDIDIAAIIAEDIELLKNSDDVDDHHRIEMALDPPSAIIRADPDQIGQIFWNLARNALQAMPRGGTLRVIGGLTAASYRLEFRDTGSGMTEAEKADLFHPFKSFFDHGTGIGMAIVYRIVEEHGGRIEAESRPGEGTAIVVELPVAGPLERRMEERRKRDRRKGDRHQGEPRVEEGSVPEPEAPERQKIAEGAA